MDIRQEAEIFSELAELCSSSGYVHTIAYLCFRDNTFSYSGTAEVEDVLQQFSMDRLVRTEISALIGLTLRNELVLDIPQPQELQHYIDRTEKLLKEIHLSMIGDPREIFNPENLSDETYNPFKQGSVLRESIFYGGEGAYQFQYRELSKLKYRKDSSWFLKNKGFTIEQAIEVIAFVQKLQNVKINELMLGMKGKSPNESTFLPAYVFTPEELSKISGHDIILVKSVIDSFVSPLSMDCFNALDDFNPTNAYPIIKIDKNQYLLFQNYSLVEALYETPFYWFIEDEAYKDNAMQNRGEFAEGFSAERLKIVFGENRVFTNVEIHDPQKNRVGEIDVLVVFANRAIIVQAKSKRLTISARQGNDFSLNDDFKSAVQDSYNQAHSCSSFLNDAKYMLVSVDGTELKINRDFKEIYPFCVVSDHYPALSFQARQFLEFTETKLIKAPFVMDVFLLDVMTEMLQSPLYFLSYVNRRTTYGDKILSTHELTILSYHLKLNLWMDGKYTMLQIEDDICADLDLAMLARRDGVPGATVPEGILTKYRGTEFHKIISDIDRLENPSTLDLGFMLLSFDGETIEMINDGISHLTKLGKKERKHHDLTLGIDDGRSGITIHCNDDPVYVSGPRLENHCRLRKYSLKAETWFGIWIDLKESELKYGVTLEYSWVQSDDMDEIVKDLPKGQSLKGISKVHFHKSSMKAKKVGRNDMCPCGSGKKYKNCCLE